MKSKERKKIKSKTTTTLKKVNHNNRRNNAIVLLIQKLIDEGLRKNQEDNYLYLANENINIKRIFNVPVSIYERYQKKFATLMTKKSGLKKGIEPHTDFNKSSYESTIGKKNGLTQMPTDGLKDNPTSIQTVVRSAVVMRRMEYNSKIGQKVNKDPYKVLIIQRRWRRYYITEIIARIKLIQSYFKRKRLKCLILLRQRLPEDACCKLNNMIKVLKFFACKDAFSQVFTRKKSSKFIRSEKRRFTANNKNSVTFSLNNTKSCFASSAEHNKNKTSLNLKQIDLNHLSKFKVSETRSFIGESSIQAFDFEILTQNNINKDKKVNDITTVDTFNFLSQGKSFNLLQIENIILIKHNQTIKHKKIEYEIENPININISNKPLNRKKKFDLKNILINKEHELNLLPLNPLKYLSIQKEGELSIIINSQDIDDISIDSCIKNNIIIVKSKKTIQRKVGNANWSYMTCKHSLNYLSSIKIIQKKYRNHLVSKLAEIKKRYKDFLLDNIKSRVKECPTTSRSLDLENEDDIYVSCNYTSLITNRAYYYDERLQKVVSNKAIMSVFPINCSIDL